MATEEPVQRGLRSRWRFATGALAAVVGLAIASGAWAAAPEHAQLSSGERAFAKAYTALVPSLNKTTSAVFGAVSKAGTYTDAQIVTVFTGLAKRWNAATKPLLALSAPTPEAGLFAAVTRYVPAVEADLLAAAQSGRTHNVSAATQAGKRLARDLNGLGGAVKALKKKLKL